MHFYCILKLGFWDWKATIWGFIPKIVIAISSHFFLGIKSKANLFPENIKTEKLIQ